MKQEESEVKSQRGFILKMQTEQRIQKNNFIIRNFVLTCSPPPAMKGPKSGKPRLKPLKKNKDLIRLATIDEKVHLGVASEYGIVNLLAEYNGRIPIGNLYCDYFNEKMKELLESAGYYVNRDGGYLTRQASFTAVRFSQARARWPGYKPEALKTQGLLEKFSQVIPSGNIILDAHEIENPREYLKQIMDLLANIGYRTYEHPIRLPDKTLCQQVNFYLSIETDNKPRKRGKR